jgi:hypothetical protein
LLRSPRRVQLYEIWMTFWPDDEIGVTSKADHLERRSTPKM